MVFICLMRVKQTLHWFTAGSKQAFWMEGVHEWEKGWWPSEPVPAPQYFTVRTLKTVHEDSGTSSLKAHCIKAITKSWPEVVCGPQTQRGVGGGFKCIWGGTDKKVLTADYSGQNQKLTSLSNQNIHTLTLQEKKKKMLHLFILFKIYSVYTHI